MNPIESVYRDISKFMKKNNLVGTATRNTMVLVPSLVTTPPSPVTLKTVRRSKVGGETLLTSLTCSWSTVIQLLGNVDKEGRAVTGFINDAVNLRGDKDGASWLESVLWGQSMNFHSPPIQRRQSIWSLESRKPGMISRRSLTRTWWPSKGSRQRQSRVRCIWAWSLARRASRSLLI